jgi:hypothetical protein
MWAMNEDGRVLSRLWKNKVCLCTTIPKADASIQNRRRNRTTSQKKRATAAELCSNIPFELYHSPPHYVRLTNKTKPNAREEHPPPPHDTTTHL